MPRSLQKVKTLFYSQRWAILPEALEEMIAVLEESNATTLSRESFHGISEEQWAAVVDGFGERSDGMQYTRIAGDVGMIEINGPLVPRATWFSEMSGLVSMEILGSEFQALDEDPTINKIVMLIDSPGGDVVGTSELSQLVKSSSTPTVAFVAGMAASGAYWIASSADSIIGVDTAIVGSIGVVSIAYKNQDEDRVEIVSSQSPKKRLEVGSDANRTETQVVVDDLAEVFIRAVADGRKTTVKNVEENFGQGGVIVSARAKAAGMIDQIGTLRAVLDGEIEKPLSDARNIAAEEINALTNPRNLSTKDQGNPKHEKTEGQNMTLAEFLAANPDAQEEITALEEAAEQRGSQAVIARVETALPILTSSVYPKPIHDAAAGFIRGEKSEAEMTGSVSGFDIAQEAAKAAAAEDDTNDLGGTPPEPPDTGAPRDGVVRDEESYQAELKKTRALMGKAE